MKDLEISTTQKGKTTFSRFYLILALVVLSLLLMPFAILLIDNALAFYMPPAEQVLTDSQLLIEALEQANTTSGQYPLALDELYYYHYLDPHDCATCTYFDYAVYPSRESREQFTLAFRKRGEIYRLYCYSSVGQEWSLAYFNCPSPVQRTEQSAQQLDSLFE